MESYYFDGIGSDELRLRAFDKDLNRGEVLDAIFVYHLMTDRAMQITERYNEIHGTSLKFNGFDLDHYNVEIDAVLVLEEDYKYQTNSAFVELPIAYLWNTDWEQEEIDALRQREEAIERQRIESHQRDKEKRRQLWLELNKEFGDG